MSKRSGAIIIGIDCIPKASQRAHDVIMSLLRQNDIAMSFWRNNNVIIAPGVRLDMGNGKTPSWLTFQGHGSKVMARNVPDFTISYFVIADLN